MNKLAYVFSLSVTFANNLFTIENRQIGRVVATVKRDGELYMVERDNSVLIFVLKKINLYVLHMTYDMLAWIR